MSYRDRYFQGKFRGLPFYTERASVRAGQRRAIYEIPFSDAGAVSIDLGRKPRRFAIKAILLEGPSTPELDKAVDAFLAALEQPGPGLLEHPQCGRLMVLPEDSIAVDFDDRDGGLAEISFEAVESRAKASAAPLVQSDSRAGLPHATANLRTANSEAFVSRFDVTRVADFVRDANVNTILVALQELRKINAVISSALAVPGELASQIDALADQVTDLLDTPQRLYDAIALSLASVYASIGRVASRFGVDTTPDAADTARPDAVAVSVRSLKMAIQSADLTAEDPPAGERDTPPREIERANKAALDQALHAAALAEIVDAANELVLPSKDETEAVRDLLLAGIEDLLLQDLEAGVVDALDDLRGAVRSRFSGAGLTALATFTPGEDMPVDVIAWQLYGDADRADEICERNDIADPGAAPGRIELEVLSE